MRLLALDNLGAASELFSDMDDFVVFSPKWKARFAFLERMFVALETAELTLKPS